MSKWVVAAKKADFDAIAKQYGISPITARIIRNRDVIGQEAIGRFLNGTMEDLYDPFLMKDMEKAVELLKGAVSEGKKIRVIGDYDADGICSSFILESALRALGASVDTAIPHRIRDGYGLNENLIRMAAEDKVECIITCDNGIAAQNEIELAHALGIMLIVTDHHEIPYSVEADGTLSYHMPLADAVVDPKRPDDSYPFKGICGAVVAYKVAQALGLPKEFLNTMVEPAAFATICDVMELLDENRILVKEGLSEMRHTNHIGLKALMDVNGIEQEQISAYHIGFVLGPCMNASGRLDSAELALKLWKEKDREKAVQLALELKGLNDERKEMTEAGVATAVGIVEEQIAKNGLPDKVQVIFLPGIHESLAGIIAGRLREKYERPCIVLTEAEEGVKGSGRSIDAYNMHEELSKCRSLFTKFGGHKMAAGLSMHRENVDLLREQLNAGCLLGEEDFQTKVTIDVPMPISYASFELIEELKILEPFGVGNPKPIFAHKNLQFKRASVIGKNRNVLKAQVLDEYGNPYDLISFSDPEKFSSFLEDKYGPQSGLLFEGALKSPLEVSVTYYPDINEYRGNRSLQIVMTGYC